MWYICANSWPAPSANPGGNSTRSALAASYPLTVPYPFTAFSFAPTHPFHGQLTSAEGDGMLVSHPRGGRSLIPPMYVVELRHALIRDSVPCQYSCIACLDCRMYAWIAIGIVGSSDVYSDRRPSAAYDDCSTASLPLLRHAKRIA